MAEIVGQKTVHPEFAGKKVIYDSHDQVRSAAGAKPRKLGSDYAVTPFPEVNFLLEVLSASDNL